MVVVDLNFDDVLHRVENNGYCESFARLYGVDAETIARQNRRYAAALREFSRLFPSRRDVRIFSAPGRTEIGGNHTDHQHGRVLAAAVDLDAIAVVSPNRERVIRLVSEGYGLILVELGDLTVHESESGTSAIVRGIASRFAQMGVEIEGFDMYCTSNVLSGSGLSSSAAFETLVGTVISCCCNENKTSPEEIARIGQYAENVYFKKSCGLMDQMVSSVGGLVAIDFWDIKNPIIRRVDADLEDMGYSICVTDTGGSHAGLSDEYGAVRQEMEEVAAQFGCCCLREVSEEDFYRNISELRRTCSDRAILRAAHFFGDDRRAAEEAAALERGDIGAFLKLVRESGESSLALLQNLYSSSKPSQQPIPLGLMVSRRILRDTGAARVHGGGFAGTIQAFVPNDTVTSYISSMESIFGRGSCLKLRIRPAGGAEIMGEGRK